MSKPKTLRARRSAPWRALSVLTLLVACFCLASAGTAAAEEPASSGQQQSLYALRSGAFTLGPSEPGYDIDWYLVDPDAESFGLSTAAELRGLAALVNGEAVDWDDEEIDPVSFQGRTIELLQTIDLSDVDAGDQAVSIEFTPIGTPDTPFEGTFDGMNHQVRNLSIEETYSYAGLFGYAGPSSTLKNVKMTGGGEAGITLSTDEDYIGCVGSLAGKADGPIQNCSSDVDIDIESHTPSSSTMPYVLQKVGGLVGYARDDMSNCSYAGNLSVQIYADAFNANSSSDSLRVADCVGGVVGRFGDPDQHGTLSDSHNLGDITVQTFGAGAEDRFGTLTYAVTFFVGGVAGYSNGSIYRCYNGAYDPATQAITGKVMTGVENGSLLGNRGADQVGGIVGSLRGESERPDKYNDGDPNDPMTIADCHNEAPVTGLVACGGIAGQTGVYCTITRCFNGSITDLSDWQRNQRAGKIISTRWNKPLSGGIVGQCRSGIISYCANYAEVRNIQTGYYMAGIAGCIFFSDDYPNVTGEIYSCFNSGGIYTINESTNVEYREAGICGDNEGYVHDCIVMEGSVPYHSDSAIGNMDWGVTSNLYVKSPEELRSPESAALLNAIAVQTQDWTCYWFINREGYPILNSWAALDDSQRIQLTADLIASTEQLEPAPYTGPGSVTIPKIKVTLTNGTVLVQDTDFFVIPQEGAYEMSDAPIYSAGIEGIGLYKGTVNNCASYSIGSGDLSLASVQVEMKKYNFGKVIFPESVQATISGHSVSSDEFDYIIYGSQTSTSAVESGGTVFKAFDSEGYISYDPNGNVKTPVSSVGIAAINAETRDWWLYDRNGKLISDSHGKTYYENGAEYSGITSCVNLKSGTPAGYVVKVSARESSAVLSGSTIGYYVIEPVNLYRECVFEKAVYDGETWYWNPDLAKFYTLDAQGEVEEGAPTVTFTGKMVVPSPTVRYGDYQLIEGIDYRVVAGNPNAAEEDVGIDESDMMRNRNVTEGSTRSAITILPLSTQNMSNYIIAYFDIVPADFADCDIELSTPAVAYTGEAVEPAVQVTLNGEKLVKDVDYTVEYANNVERGTASFTVTPLANLSGGSTEPYEGTFTIDDGISMSTLTLGPIADQQFNWGYDVHPTLSFFDASGDPVELTEGVDYEVSYSGAKITSWPDTGASIAPQTATVTGKGLYVGQLQGDFHIVPYNATLNRFNQLRAVTQNMAYGTWGMPSTSTVTMSDGTKKPVGVLENVGVRWPVMAVAAYPIVDWEAYEAGDYDSCYGRAIAMTRSNNNVNGGLINRYPARYYNALGVEVSADGSVYTNTNGSVLAETAQAAPGPITVQISFRCGTGGDKGGATGSLTTEFMYTSPAALSTLDWVVGEGGQPMYNGQAHTPITATMHGTGFGLTEGVDYTIEYADNVDAGVATFTATGIEGGHFTGTYSGEFTILPYNLAADGAATIDAIKSQPLVDEEQGACPVPVVRADGSVLVKDVDYEVRYQNNHTLGDNGVCVVMGVGNYSGTITAQFSIVAVKYGDVNLDGKVNAIDATLVRRYSYKQITFNDYQMKAANVSGDTRVNAIDATLILRYAYKQINSFPVEA